jgi:hypothetical protein
MESDYLSMLKKERKEEMKTSPQLTLGKLIKALESIPEQSNPVVLANTEYNVTGFCSWRGSYCEISIEYEKNNKKVTTKQFLEMCKRAVGRKFSGYKGGQYTMGKTTPVWIANYGHVGSLSIDLCGLVGVENKKNKTYLLWAETPYLGQD